MRQTVLMLCMVAAISCDRQTETADVSRDRGHPDYGPPRERLIAAAFSPDGKQILTAYFLSEGRPEPKNPRTLVLWEVETGKKLWTVRKEQVDGYGNRFAFFPDGKQILVWADNTLKVLDTATGKIVRTFDEDAKKVICFAFAPDGKVLVVGYKDGTLKVVKVENGKEIHSCKAGGYVLSVAVSPDSKWAATVSRPVINDSGVDSGGTYLVSLGTGKIVQAFETAHEWRGPVAFSSDSERLVIGRSNREKEEYSFEIIEVDTGISNHILSDTAPMTVAFTSDGKNLLSGSNVSDKLILQDTKTGKEKWSVHLDGPMIRAIAVSSDAKMAFANNKVWDAVNGKLLREFDDPKDNLSHD
jgi:WD40 repeat protein